jgi:hypothetical protein
VNSVKVLAVVAALFASQSAFATTYDLGLLTPPVAVSQESDNLGSAANFLDYFTFTLTADAATLFGSAPDVKIKIDGLKNKINIKDVDLFSGDIGYGSLVKHDLDKSDEGFSFKKITAGSYYLTVEGTQKGAGNGSYTLNIAATPATAVPEPEAYAMMLAGLGLIGFAARRKQA